MKGRSRLNHFGNSGFLLIGPLDINFGILRTFRDKRCEELWNRRNNIKVGLLNAQWGIDSAKKNMKIHGKQARQMWGSDVPVSHHKESSCVFEDGTSMEIWDAVDIQPIAHTQECEKDFVDYCYWENFLGIEKFSPFDKNGRNSVKLVCQSYHDDLTRFENDDQK